MDALNKSKWKIKVVNGERYYESGPHAGKKVGSVRNGSIQDKKDREGNEYQVSDKSWHALSPNERMEIYLDHNPERAAELDQLKYALAERTRESMMLRISGRPNRAKRVADSVVKLKAQYEEAMLKLHQDAVNEPSKKIEKSLKNKLLKGSDSVFYSVVVPIFYGKVLIGKRLEDGIWTTPAGGGKKGENPLDTAVREMHEEAGIDVVREKLVFLCEKKAPNNGKKVYCYLYNMNHVPVIAPDDAPKTFTNLDPDNEVAQWIWVSPENLPQDMKNPNNSNRLETINEALIKDKGLLEETVVMNVELKRALQESFDRALEKGGKKAEVGEIRTWGKDKYIKQTDGWYYLSGTHAGKKMGSVKSTKTAKPEPKEEPKKPETKTEAPKPKEKESEIPKTAEEALKNKLVEAVKTIQSQVKAGTPFDEAYSNWEKNTTLGAKLKEGVKSLAQEFANKPLPKDDPKLNEIKAVQPKVDGAKTKEKSTADTRPEYSLLDYSLNTKQGGKSFVGKSLPTGKTSKVEFKLTSKKDTNMVGKVAFGKTSVENQKKLNVILNEANDVIGEMGIKFKNPIDFVCQNLKNPNKTAATFSPLDHKYDVSNRIDIKDYSSASLSLMHEIGHALDYALSSEEGRKYFSDNSEALTQLKSILANSPYYQKHGTGKFGKYLRTPTEIFARCFEVYSFSIAKKLVSEGKISEDFLNNFNPDFLKASDSGRISAEEAFNKYGTEEQKAVRDQLLKEREELNSMRAKLYSTPGMKLGGPEMEAFYSKQNNVRALSKKYDAALKVISREKSNVEGKVFRNDAEETEKEIVALMSDIIKNNEIKKGLFVKLTKI